MVPQNFDTVPKVHRIMEHNQGSLSSMPMRRPEGLPGLLSAEGQIYDDHVAEGRQLKSLGL